MTFNQFGRVRDVDIKYGRARNGTAYAFAEFADSEGAEKAVAQGDDFKLSGARVKIEFTGGSRKVRGSSDAPPRHSGSYSDHSDNKVIITGLPPNTSWQDIKDHMRKAGAVAYAMVYDDGVGVVEYRDHESVQEAVRLMDRSTIFTHVEQEGEIRVCLPDQYDGHIPSGRGRHGGDQGERSASSVPRRRYRSPPSPMGRRRRYSPSPSNHHRGSYYGPGKNSYSCHSASPYGCR